ncbi:MAG: histidine kinase, partial [Bacteroidota bacterium]
FWLFFFVGSLFFSACDWFVNRFLLIQLRIQYPSLKDSTKRIIFLVIGTVTIVTLVDIVGINLISLLFDNVRYHFPDRVRSLVVAILLTTMVMAIYEAIYFFVLLKRSIREEEQAKRAIIQAELDTLRNQAQPHFFFNTLNTLRDIIDQSPKEEAKKFVNKLSDIYRFLLDSGNTNLISLKSELKFAKAYIHVQSERFGANLQVKWNIQSSLNKQLIAPMSLQLLLENAIKHNVISRSRPLEIHVTTTNEYLIVTNKIQKKSTQLPSTKMGLKNIEKRYALISDRFVKISNDGDQFNVSLPLLNPNMLKRGL